MSRENMASCRSEFGSLYDLIRCPYNTSHQIQASRFPNHIVKCRKQHPELAKVFVICNYNQSHHVHEKDMESHLLTCVEYQVYECHRHNYQLPPPVQEKDELLHFNRGGEVCIKATVPPPTQTVQDVFNTRPKLSKYSNDDMADWV